MNSRSDSELLAEYVRAGSREAFTELVARHRDWVHSVAVRRVHDEHLADDVTQAVFIVLARRARGIKEGTVLSAWLFGVARYAATNAVRGESRRKRHETAAAAMKQRETAIETSSEADDAIAGELDRAVANLGSRDRTAVLLRFYERKSLAEVGQALAISEEAARKRIERAVEKLRRKLAGTGAPVSGLSTAAIASWMDQNGVHVANIQAHALATAALAAAHPPGAVGASITLAKGAIRMLIWNKIKWIAAICLLALIPVAVPHIQFIFREAAQTGAVAGEQQTQPATVEFHIIADYATTRVDDLNAMDLRLAPGGPGPAVQPGDTVRWVEVRHPQDFDQSGTPPETREWSGKRFMPVLVTPEASMDQSSNPGWSFARVVPRRTLNGSLAIAIEFDAHGAELFSDLTTRWFNLTAQREQHARLAVLCGNVIVTAPRLNSPVTGGSAIITGGGNGFTSEEARRIFEAMNSEVNPPTTGPATRP